MPIAGDVVEEAVPAALEAGRWVLIVEDDEATRVLYERYLKDSPFRPVGVPSLAAGRSLLRAGRPVAVVLDILLPGEEELTWCWLAETKSNDPALPVIVASASLDERKARALGADAYFHKPVARSDLIETLLRLAPDDSDPVALIIDDDESSRYVIRRSIGSTLRFAEAGDGASGLDLAHRLSPRVIFLDLVMPGMGGEEVLERLGDDPLTAGIPVVVVTSLELDSDHRARVARRASGILQKRDLSVETLSGMLEHVLPASTRTSVGSGAVSAAGAGGH